MRRLTLLALAACSSASSRPAQQLPPPEPLDIEVSALIPGYDGTITVRGLGAYEQAHVAMGFALGAGPCIPGAGGLCLEITQNPAYLGTADADADGTAVYTVAVPDTAPVGAEVAFQALAVRGIGGVDTLASPGTLAMLVDDDVDGDGFNALVDCDDDEPAAYPGAEERCDGIDNDCDGQVEPADAVALVDGRFPYDFVASAIASAPDGSVVEICAGVHEIRGIRVDRPMTIRGQGPGVTSLVARSGVATIRFWARDVALEGFDGTGITVDSQNVGNTVRNLVLTGVNPTPPSTVVGVLEHDTYFVGDPMLVEDTRIHDNGTSALYVTSNMELNRVELSNNTSLTRGGGVHIIGAGVDGTDVSLWGNSGPRGGALEISSNGSFDCASCDLGIGTTDNLPLDIYLGGTLPGSSAPAQYGTFYDDETFSCSLTVVGFDREGSCTR
jgi:hypothetical protein